MRRMNHMASGFALLVQLGGVLRAMRVLCAKFVKDHLGDGTKDIWAYPHPGLH